MGRFILCVFVVWTVAVLPATADAQVAAGRGPAVSGEDEAYLRGVEAETWACIAHFVEPTTGLPYDTSERGEYTSVTNLGYYAAACAVAAEMKLIPRDEATIRVRRVLDAYAKFKQWHGFSQSWNPVRRLGPLSLSMTAADSSYYSNSFTSPRTPRKVSPATKNPAPMLPAFSTDHIRSY